MLYTDCRLRPMVEDDRPRVLAWRNQDRVRANMYSDHVITADEHDRWFDRSLTDSLAVYRVFEHRGRPLGFLSFTQIDRVHGRCTWGFYVGETDAPRGSGGAMQFMALDEAFGPIGIRKVCSEVFASNAGSVRLHLRLGFTQEGFFERHHLKNGVMQDVICLARFGDDWPAERPAIMADVFEEEAA